MERGSVFLSSSSRRALVPLWGLHPRAPPDPIPSPIPVDLGLPRSTLGEAQTPSPQLAPSPSPCNLISPDGAGGPAFMPAPFREFAHPQPWRGSLSLPPTRQSDLWPGRSQHEAGLCSWTQGEDRGAAERSCVQHCAGPGLQRSRQRQPPNISSRLQQNTPLWPPSLLEPSSQDDRHYPVSLWVGGEQLGPWARFAGGSGQLRCTEVGPRPLTAQAVVAGTGT